MNFPADRVATRSRQTFFIATTAIVATAFADLSLVTAHAQSAGPTGGTGAQGSVGGIVYEGGVGGGPGAAGQDGTGSMHGTGGAAGGNATVGQNGTAGGNAGGAGGINAPNIGSGGGGGGPSITGLGTTATLTNALGTTLTGSDGQTSNTANGTAGGAGGYGVVVTTGGGTNAGTILGGNGGNGRGDGNNLANSAGVGGGGGNGGGALFLGSNIVFGNTGVINNAFQFIGVSGGSNGTTTRNGGQGGAGGAGVEFAGSNSTLNNTGGGAIAGSSGGTGGGGSDNTSAGGVAGAGGAGGRGGAGVVFDQSNGRLENSASTIRGGAGGFAGLGGQASNAAGGVGGTGGSGGNGGLGVAFQGSNNAFNNSGIIVGGAGGPGSDGGSGFNTGGPNPTTAGIGGSGGAGGNGGAGVLFLGTGNVLTNGGTIAGGNGTRGGAGGQGAGGVRASGGASGAGGIGLLATGTTINNIAGGAISGGTGGAAGGIGGAGIVGSNLIIANAGTINGGFTNTATAPNGPPVFIFGPSPGLPIGARPGAEPFTAGAQAYAIELTGGTNYVGTGGTITGGINVTGNASFMPALPGSTVGTPLAVTGPLMFASTSTYNIRITPTASDSTVVTGAATLNGAKVAVVAGQGTYQVRQYTILSATAGVAGTFNPNVASNLAFLTPTLSYDFNNVYLTVQPSTPTAAGTPDYRTAANTQNQRNVAAGLTNAGVQNGGKGPILNGLNQLTAPQARAAFDALSGEGLTAAQNIANRSAELFTSSIFDQTTFYGSGNAANAITLTEPIRELADLPSGKVQPPFFVQPNRTWRAWATGFGGVDDIHGNGQTGSAYQQNTIYGGTLGVDYQLMPNYLVGVAIGGTNGDFLVPGRATSGSTTGGHVAFYDLATFGSFYGASSTSFSYFGNRATRTVSGFGGLGTETERANFNSNEFRTRLEFGRHLAGYGGVLTPFVALELAQLRSNGFTENAVQGAGLFRLNVSGQSQASAPAFVGLRLQRATSLGNGITLSPTLQVAYVHEFAPYRSQIGTLADLPGSTFLVDGARPARDAAQVKAGAEMAIGARSMIFANFDGEFSGVNQLYAGKGGFRYLW